VTDKANPAGTSDVATEPESFKPVRQAFGSISL